MVFLLDINSVLLRLQYSRLIMQLSGFKFRFNVKTRTFNSELRNSKLANPMGMGFSPFSAREVELCWEKARGTD
jgi:hypothetical protein